MAFSVTSWSLPFFGFMILCFIVAKSAEILVGGRDDSWKIPSSPLESLNRWVFKLRFAVNDSLVFKYDEKVDSVLEVRKSGYYDCETSNPIRSHKDGLTKIKLPKLGHYYFISGAKGHCEKGQKLRVIARKKHRRPVVWPPAEAPSSNDNDYIPAPVPSPNRGNYIPTEAPYIPGIAPSSSGYSPELAPSPNDEDYVPGEAPSTSDDKSDPWSSSSPSDDDYVPRVAPSANDHGHAPRVAPSSNGDEYIPGEAPSRTNDDYTPKAAASPSENDYFPGASPSLEDGGNGSRVAPKVAPSTSSHNYNPTNE